MIFMPVRDQVSVDPASPFEELVDIRVDGLDAKLGRVGEHDTTIDDKKLAAIHVTGEVHAKFAAAPKREQANDVFIFRVHG